MKLMFFVLLTMLNVAFMGAHVAKGEFENFLICLGTGLFCASLVYDSMKEKFVMRKD